MEHSLGGGSGHELEGDKGGGLQLHPSLGEIYKDGVVFFHGILP